MHRCSSGLFLSITITLVTALAGCLGKSSPNSTTGKVQSVSLNPGNKISIDVGTSQIFTAGARDASGHSVLGVVSFSVVSGDPNSPAPLSIASNGNACAGTWDPTVSQCSAGSPGVALVTATIDGVSSPPTTVYVHLHIDNLQVVPAQQVPPIYDCYSQGETALYQGVAYSRGVDITSTVGQLTWTTTNAGVLTTNTNPPVQPPLPLNQVQITAANPGITQLFTAVAGSTSNSVPVITCLVRYVRVQAQSSTASSISVNTGNSVTILASAVDTLGHTLIKPPLTWSSSDPEVVSFANAANSTGQNIGTARANLGGASVTASCTPPTCNIGLLPSMPVYASAGTVPNGLPGYGAISVNVTTTSTPPVYTGWAATDQCGENAVGCTSVMFSANPGKNPPIIATANVTRTPNSLVFNHVAAARAYLGSSQGLMFSDLGGASPAVSEVSNASSPCNVILCGKVLGVSNDGKQVVVSDNVSATPEVYIYNGASNAVNGLILSNVASAAAFSPDQSKIFILTDAGTMYVFSTVDALAPVAIPTSGTDVAFSADSSFAYVAGTSGGGGSVSAFSACALPGVPSTELGTPVATTGLPLRIFPSPNTQTVVHGATQYVSQTIFVLVASAKTSTSVQVLNAQFTQVPIPLTLPLPQHSQLTCIPPDLFSFTADPALHDLGQGAFTPLYARLVGDGSEIIVVGQNIPAVLVYNVASGTTTPFGLVNGAIPLAASASTDGSQIYVAACDQYLNNDPKQACTAGSVHIVNTTGQVTGEGLGDFQQVPYTNNLTNNMCSNLGSGAPVCVPDLVAIQPK